MDNNVEVRGSTMLSRASFVALLEKMFKGCTEPPNAPAPLSEEFKKKRENSVRVRDHKLAEPQREHASAVAVRVRCFSKDTKR